MIELMDRIADTAHSGQFRKDGKTPYIIHPRAVAAVVEKRLKPIALGHDLGEDTEITTEELVFIGFDSYVTNAIDLLTHKHRVPNVVYWNNILTNSDAVIVKIEDIKHNLSSAPTIRQIQKYAQALEIFKKSGYKVE